MDLYFMLVTKGSGNKPEINKGLAQAPLNLLQYTPFWYEFIWGLTSSVKQNCAAFCQQWKQVVALKWDCMAEGRSLEIEKD
jgi:hypothetical protein